MTPDEAPDYYTGPSDAADGTLLISDGQSATIWRSTTPELTDFAVDTELRKAIWLSKAGALLLAGDASDLFVSTDGLRWEKLHWEPATFPPTPATEYGRPAEWIDTVAKSPTNEPQVRRSRRVVITSDTI